MKAAHLIICACILAGCGYFLFLCPSWRHTQQTSARLTVPADAKTRTQGITSSHFHASVQPKTASDAVWKSTMQSAEVFARSLAVLQSEEREALIHDRPDLSMEALSNILDAVMSDASASHEILRNTYHMQTRLQPDGDVVTNKYYWRFEYVLSRLWRESPYPEIRYWALITLMNDYLRLIDVDEYSRKMDLLRLQLIQDDQGEQSVTQCDDGMQNMLGRLDDELALLAALRSEEAYLREAARIQRRWAGASEISRLNRNLGLFNALVYVKTPTSTRDKYLPTLLEQIPIDRLRSIYKDDMKAEIVDYWKRNYQSKKDAANRLTP